MLEGLLGEAAPVVQRRILLAQTLNSLIVVCRVDEDEDRREVFGSGAQHGGPADIDVLERVFEGNLRPRNRLAEGVEVHRHEVDLRKALTGQLIEVLGLVAAG